MRREGRSAQGKGARIAVHGEEPVARGVGGDGREVAMASVAVLL